MPRSPASSARLACVATGTLSALLLVAESVQAQNTLVVAGMPRYQPTGYPDRIVLTFAGEREVTSKLILGSPSLSPASGVGTSAGPA